MMWWTDGVGWGGWVVMTFVMVLFWGLVIFGILAIFQGARGDRWAPTREQEDDPLRTLDDRFARGEIDANEYHARRNVLRALH